MIFSRAGDQWRIELTPNDSGMASGIKSILVTGKGDGIKGFEIKQANGDTLNTELHENF